MQTICPDCGHIITAESMNVGTDLAHCARCNQVHKISSLVAETEGGFDANSSFTPDGTSFTPSFDGFTLSSTTRNKLAFFLVPFTCFWSGGSLSMIYGQQIIKGEFDPGQSLFGIPFLIGTCVLVPVCLMMTVGRVVISVHNGEGTIFSGIGPFGLRHKFDWTAVTGVSLALWGKSQPPMYRIQLLGTPRQFGTMVSRARQSYLIGTLRRLLKERRIQPKR